MNIYCVEKVVCYYVVIEKKFQIKNTPKPRMQI